jgi:hypothetical protein
MYSALIWIAIWFLVSLYHYNKIMGVVFKKTKFKNQQRSMWNHFKNEQVIETFLNIKLQETDQKIIKEYKRLILMIWLPIMIMCVGLSIMMLIELLI